MMVVFHHRDVLCGRFTPFPSPGCLVRGISHYVCLFCVHPGHQKLNEETLKEFRKSAIRIHSALRGTVECDLLPGTCVR